MGRTVVTKMRLIWINSLSAQADSFATHMQNRKDRKPIATIPNYMIQNTMMIASITISRRRAACSNVNHGRNLGRAAPDAKTTIIDRRHPGLTERLPR